MKLAAIYNVWDGVELLEGSIKCIASHVDLIVIVYQTVSNFGEAYDPIHEILTAVNKFPTVKFHIRHFTPNGINGAGNETAKRNIGLNIAREYCCTHFLHMDCDEYYLNFGELKQEFIQSGLAGSVCRIMTYFSKPTLRLRSYDNYFVPFIHRLEQGTKAGGREYSYYVDPTRRINVIGDTGMIGEKGDCMHHFSWVRKDIDRKVRNSSARANINKSTLLEDYHKATAGMFVAGYNQDLVEVENVFGIEI